MASAQRDEASAAGIYWQDQYDALLNTAAQCPFAYGRTRAGGGLPTDRTFTGQVQDASGLIYMNARDYDPAPGHCLSPDTRVAQAVSLRALPKPGRASWLSHLPPAPCLARPAPAAIHLEKTLLTLARR